MDAAMEKESTDLVIPEAREASAVELFEPKFISHVICEIQRLATEHTPDTSTAKGRKEIAAVANKVARSKTFLDGIGKDYVAGIKETVKGIDASRKEMRDSLDELKATVRKPLTDWENEEKARQAMMDQLVELCSPDCEPMSSCEISERIEEIRAFDVFALGGLVTEGASVIDNAVTVLEQKRAAKAQYEAEQIELARLRKEKEEAEAKRAQAERDERIRQEATAAAEKKAAEEVARIKAQADAEEAERKRVDDEIARAEKKRIEDEDHRQAVREEAVRELVREGIEHLYAMKLIGAIEGGRVSRLAIDWT